MIYAVTLTERLEFIAKNGRIFSNERHLYVFSNAISINNQSVEPEMQNGNED